ncbi:MAG: transporter substrate-binding domain-containing protein [Bdellovibrionales bacterium]|jgi:ABC-type amino acid transport substrate-binding protein
MKISQLALTVLLSAAVAFGVVKVASPTTTTATAKETAFQRVMRSQTIRCAYALSGPPRFIPDPNTKALQGSLVDIMEEIGKVLHLKIEWAEDTGYGTFAENLRSGKEDMFCGTVWTSSARAHKILLTSPLFFASIHAYVKEGDNRFDNKPEALNNDSVTLSVMDGASGLAVASTTFPKANLYKVPQLGNISEIMMGVATGKADATIFDESNILAYNKKNPQHPLRRVLGLPPLRLYGESFAVGMGEFELRELLNTAISELQNNGTIDSILKKYEPEYGRFERARDPFAPL